MRTLVAGGAVAVVVILASSASAQTPQGPFTGSVAQGQATAETVSLTLPEAIDRGLKFNLALINVEQQVQSARGSRVRALRDLLPHLEARVDEMRQTRNLAAFGFDTSLFPGVPSVVGPFNLFDARVYASQPILDFGALRDLQSREAALDAVKFDQMNARDTVVFVVSNLYFQAVAGGRRIQTARAQVTTAEALFTQATALRNAGAAPGIDVVRAQVQVQAQRQRLIAAENEWAKQLLQLARAIGLPAAQRIQLADEAVGPPQTMPVEEALAHAAAQRADYKANLARVRAAEATLASAKGGALPSVRVSADYGTIGSSPADARRTYTMAVGVRVPLFDQDRVGRQVETQAALRQRQAEAEDLAQRIEAEVRTALLDVQAAEQQLAVARERVTLADQELSLARIRFTAGVTGNLEVIQAQNEVATASDAEVAATYAVNIARAALARAIGGTP